MISAETAAVFFLASLLLGIAPGPDNLFVLTQSALHGRPAGIFVTLGLCTGLVCHTAAVALGVAVIFQTSAIAFSVLKYLGAAYLLFLAWQAFHAGASKIETKGADEFSMAKLYRRGIIMNITNPKVSIFFLAFLPQFADPSKGLISLQMMQLGGIFITATVIVFGSVAMAAGTLGKWLGRSDLSQKIMNRIAGAVFLGIAIKLACSQKMG